MIGDKEILKKTGKEGEAAYLYKQKKRKRYQR